MGSWSSIFTTLFAKRLLGLIEKRMASYPADKAALNVYYLQYSLNAANSDVFNKKREGIITNLHRVVDEQCSIVYPLSRKEFLADLWQTSARLLVLVEDNTLFASNPQEFNHELNSVTNFIAGGGRVMLLLDPSNQCLLETENSFGTALSKSMNDVPEHFVLGESTGDLWQWHIRPTNSRLEHGHSIDGLPPRMLIGSHLNGSEQSVLFIALLLDCADQNPHLLLEAATLLGVPCKSQFNDSSMTKTTSPSERIVLYCLSEQNKPRVTPEMIQSKLLSENSNSEVRYEVRTVSVPDPALPSEFSWSDYLNTLQTRVLGRALLWAESLPSSFILGERLLSSLPADSGLTLVSNIQTEGKGRGSNHWITPVGQAAFTFHATLRKPFNYQRNSGPPFPFMNLVTCMQHLVALAIVLASRRILAGRLGFVSNENPEPDLEWLASLKLPGLDLRVKWPNDVYVVEAEDLKSAPDVNGSNDVIVGKMAGLLTKCTVSGTSQVDCLAGVGINVQNELPSICLQQVLDRLQPSALPVTTAEVIGQVLNQLERMLDHVLSPKATHSLDWLLDLYKQCWMHNHQRVLVSTPPVAQDGTARACVIVGLDAFGYLRVRDAQNGAEYTLHPNGNSMDMMRGLICPK